MRAATSLQRRRTWLSIADALEIERFAVMGHSGGGPHALACAALLPERVLGAVSLAGLAPYGAADLDWFEGINPSGTAELQAARLGREALAACLEAGEFDPEMFTPSRPRRAFRSVVLAAQRGRPGHRRWPRRNDR